MQVSATHETINVFVYGTLLFPEITARLEIESRSSDSLIRRPAKLSGYKRFTVRFRGEGDPPAIIPAENSSVAGQVLCDITEESLQRLDWFEDIASELYTREEVCVELQDGEQESLEVLTYVCGERIRSQLNGGWDPEVFRERDLSWYLKNVLGE